MANKSHRLGIPITRSDVDSGVKTEVKTCKEVTPTPVDCIKYGINLSKAKIMDIKDLTLDDYLYLRRVGKLNKQKIKNLYGFEHDAIFYKILRDIGAHPEPEQITDVGIAEKPEFAELGQDTVPEIIEQSPATFTQADADRVLAKVEPVPPVTEPEPADIPALPKKLSIITKHICPVCLEEFDILTDAETCLNGHTYAVGIEGASGYSDTHNCPAVLFIKLSDGRVVEYYATGRVV